MQPWHLSPPPASQATEIIYGPNSPSEIAYTGFAHQIKALSNTFHLFCNKYLPIGVKLGKLLFGGLFSVHKLVRPS